MSRVIEDVFVRVGHALPRLRGRALLPAAGDQGRLGYLRLLLNPQDVISFRRVVNMPKRGIGDATVAAIESFAATEGIDVVEACRRVDEIAMLKTRAKGAVAGFNQVMTALRGALRRGRRPGAHDRARRTGVRLPRWSSRRSAPSRRRAASRTSRSSPASRWRSSRATPMRVSTSSSSMVSLVGEQDELRGGGLERHADDAAHRQGAGVPGRVHRGDGGRDLPALPVDDRHARARGGAPARVRRHHARAAAAVPDARLEPHACSARRTTTRRRGSSARSPSVSCDARESETRVQPARSAYGGGQQAGGANGGGYTVVGLPGRGARFAVEPGWTPPAVPGVTRREVPAHRAGDTVRARAVGRRGRRRDERVRRGRRGHDPVRRGRGEAGAAVLRAAHEGRLTLPEAGRRASPSGGCAGVGRRRR